MKFKNTLLCLIITILMANSETLKVIFARNSTASAIRRVETERSERDSEQLTNTGSIITIPGNCKPGFVYESTFHHRCRKIAG